MMVATLNKDFTVDEAARHLGVHHRLIRAAISAGQLVAWNSARPNTRVPRWRISLPALEQWRLSRTSGELTEQEQKVRLLPRMEGATERRIAARQARRERGAARS